MSCECLDIFCHCLPPAYCQAVQEAANRPLLMFERAQKIRVMVDLPARLQVMDEFPGYRQLVSLASPPVEVFAPEAAEKLAIVANNEMAKMVNESDGRIAGFVATLPLNLPERSVQEAQRADLNGWVRNHSDGSVEALFAGLEDSVDAMTEACRQGPPSAQVTDVVVEPFEGPLTPGFRQLPTV